MSDADHVQGTFNTPIPCPDCGGFMSTDYDPMGLPAAHCTNQTCPTGHLPDDWLKQNGHWEEGD